MNCGSIYKIVFPNGKHYIGLTTTSLKQRQKEHKICAKNETKQHLVYRSLRCHNMVDTFELVEIDTADTLEELCKKEIEYIQIYNSYYMDGNGYNMTLGGEGTNGYVYTEEDKQKNSERQKKYYEDNPEEKEQMKKISQDFWNKPDSHETMSKIRLISHNTPQAKQNIRDGIKKYYEETPGAREKNSEALTKHHKEHPETGEKVSESLKTHHKEHPETREKLSELHIQYHKKHPEAGKEHGDKMKQYYINNPKARLQMSEIKKQSYINNPKTILQMSEIKKQYYIDNPEAIYKKLDTQGNNKPFDVFTKDGTFIQSFTYQFDAKNYLRKEYNITSIISIGEVLRGTTKSSAGFVFKYK